MEKILLAVNTLKTEGPGKRLLSIMMDKKVPGFCVEVFEALEVFGMNRDSE